MNYREKYIEIRKAVDALPLKAKEKKRVEDEENIFSLLEWEEYIALALDMAARVENFPLLEDTVGGTLFSSFFFHLARKRSAQGFHGVSYEDFSKGQLTLRLNALGPGAYIINQRIREIYQCVDVPLKSSGLFYESFSLQKKPEGAFTAKRIVVSNKERDLKILKEDEEHNCFLIDVISYKAL